ncbi:MAG TPA: hypothetical protein ENJ65_02250 [Candidatus Tenderia electrophaga]|uniref:Uncharacterized protein n=1 Tax=Candidatus Tenderia electrophaga TaxID=1748243 RepID=A0A832J665_9GAMM|nr:hypothetical protein [Candidatus Tenderia electrophaga]
MRYEPQAAQQGQNAAAQMQQRQQLSAVQTTKPRSPAEQTLEGELLNKAQQQSGQSSLSEEEFLARHQEQRARSTEGYRSQTERALATYQTNALLTHPANVDRIGFLDVYA